MLFLFTVYMLAQVIHNLALWSVFSHAYDVCFDLVIFLVFTQPT